MFCYEGCFLLGLTVFIGIGVWVRSLMIIWAIRVKNQVLLPLFVAMQILGIWLTFGLVKLRGFGLEKYSLVWFVYLCRVLTIGLTIWKKAQRGT